MVGGFGAFALADERHMHAYKIALVQRLGKTTVTDAGLVPLQPMLLAKIHQELHPLNELVIVISRIVADHVHVEAGAFANHRLADASGADDGNRLAAYFIAQKWQKWMPRAPALLAHL